MSESPMRTRLTELFGIEVPIFGFTNCPHVCAAISRAGGMGVFGAIPYSAEELEEHLTFLDKATEGKPYGVDVVMPKSYAGAEQGGFDKATLRDMIPAEARAWINGVLERYGVPELPPGDRNFKEFLGWTDQFVRPQVEVAFRHPVRLLVNALGPPPVDIVERAHAQGVRVGALAGTAHHAREHVRHGVDIVIAVGTEAAGHTGEIGTFVLVPEVVDAVAPVPVLAGGGVGTGRQMAAALALGAEGVWCGSIWLTTTENSMVTPMQVRKLLRASSGDTVRSRALSGKPARQLRTAWTDAWEAPDSPGPFPLPLQFIATAEAVRRIHKFGDDESTRAHELLGSPVGQIVGVMNEVVPTATVITRMVEQYRASIERLPNTRS